MKKIILLSSLLVSEVMIAGNNFPSGDPVSTTAVATGVALKLNEGAAIFENPSMLSESALEVGQTKLNVGAILFNIDSKSYPSGDDQTGYKDGASGTTIPTFSVAHAFCDKIRLGLGFYALTGGSSDYSKEAAMGNSKSEYFINSIPLVASYTVNSEFAASLSLHYLMGSYETNNGGALNKSATDSGMAAALGLKYNIPGAGRVGFHYFAGGTSTFKEVTDLDALSGTPDGVLDDLKIGTPAHMTLAYAHPVMEGLDATIEFQQINWSTSEHYKDLNWENENLISIAASYMVDPKITVRGGLAQYTGGIPEESGVNGLEAATYQGKTTNRATLQGINARSGGAYKSGISLGGSYMINEKMTVHGGFIVASKNKIKQNSTITTQAGTIERNAALEVAASEYALSLDYTF